MLCLKKIDTELYSQGWSTYGNARELVRGRFPNSLCKHKHSVVCLRQFDGEDFKGKQTISHHCSNVQVSQGFGIVMATQ